MNLRERASQDLKHTLEKAFALPVVLISPDGVKIENNNDGVQLSGQVLYDYKKYNPDTGSEIVIDLPVVTLRIDSLPRVPVAGEKWIVLIPEKPTTDAEMIQYVVDTSSPPQGSKSIGMIRLYLRKLKDINA